MAQRIRARAIRRAGELLAQIEPQRGANQNIDAGSGTKVQTRKDAANDAGMSHRQMHTALRVASVPPADFEAMVEAKKPATVTQIAAQARGLSDQSFGNEASGFCR